METKNGRSRACIDRSPWKRNKRIWWVDSKATDDIQGWRNAKDCTVGSFEDIGKGAEDVKKRSIY